MFPLPVLEIVLLVKTVLLAKTHLLVKTVSLVMMLKHLVYFVASIRYLDSAGTYRADSAYDFYDFHAALSYDAYSIGIAAMPSICTKRNYPFC